MAEILRFPVANTFADLLRGISEAAAKDDLLHLDETAAESLWFLMEEAFPVLRSLTIANSNGVSLSLPAEDAKDLQALIDGMGARIDETARALDRQMADMDDEENSDGDDDSDNVSFPDFGA